MNPDAKKVILYIQDTPSNLNDPNLVEIRKMTDLYGITVEVVHGSTNNLKNALK